MYVRYEASHYQALLGILSTVIPAVVERIEGSLFGQTFVDGRHLAAGHPAALVESMLEGASLEEVLESVGHEARLRSVWNLESRPRCKGSRVPSSRYGLSSACVGYQAS